MEEIKIELLREAKCFLERVNPKAREKILENLRDISGGEINPILFKKLSGDIWELRTLFGGLAYRLFAFWDKKRKSLIIATHGIIKKTQSTPRKEILKAEKIRLKYYNKPS